MKQAKAVESYLDITYTTLTTSERAHKVVWLLYAMDFASTFKFFEDEYVICVSGFLLCVILSQSCCCMTSDPAARTVGYASPCGPDDDPSDRVIFDASQGYMHKHQSDHRAIQRHSLRT